MPFGTELSRSIARSGAFPDVDKANDLALVASYFVYRHGDRRMLNVKLREALNVTCRPGKLHRLLAGIAQPLLLVTTNYDGERRVETKGTRFLCFRHEAPQSF